MRRIIAVLPLVAVVAAVGCHHWPFNNNGGGAGDGPPPALFGRNAEPKAAGGANLSGKYVFIWKKVGSDWKIWTDIWASHSGQT